MNAQKLSDQLKTHGTLLIRGYIVLLFAWAILHGLFGDRWSWLFLLNSFAPYLFIGLPIVFVIALATRRQTIWIGCIASIALAAYLYGGLFVPKIAPAHSHDKTLVVMTYNMLVLNRHPESVIATIQKANPDIVAIQELDPLAANAIQKDLKDTYPYQFLDPQEDSSGMGVISRYPLRTNGETLPGEWVGQPQVLNMDWQGAILTILHFHPMPSNFALADFFLDQEQVEWTIQERERDVEVLANFAAAQNGPLVALGDFNVTDQSGSYQIMTHALADSWREAGWGFGTTWPAPDLFGQSRIDLAGIPMPAWLIRIDYIFHSLHWRAVSAEIGPWDGYSDHRPVVVKLTLEVQ
jgi:vancomycin resistance protein VanJ